MNQKYKLLAKDTIIFALGSLGSKLILFFLLPLYTNYLTTEEYGIADLVTSCSQLLIPFSALVINQALIRFGMKKTEKPEDVLKSAFVVLFFSVFATVMLTMIAGFYTPISSWKWYMAILVILSNVSEVEKSYLKVKNRNVAFSIISIFETLCLAISNIVLLVLFNTGIRGYLLANIIALSFTTFVSFIAAGVFRDFHRGRTSADLLKKMIVYSSPLVFSSVSWWIIHSADKIMIEWMIGASALGIYTVSTKIPSLINVIIGVFNQAWGLSTIREIETTDSTDFYSTIFNVFSTLLFGASIIFTTLIRPFMSIYVGEDFVDAWKYTPLLLSAAVFYSVSAFIGTLYAALQRTTNDMWTSIICVVVNVFANYIGIKMIGIWGAVIGTVIAYFVISTTRLFDVQRYIKFNVKPIKYWINVILMMVHAILVSLNWHIIPVSSIIIVLYVVLNRDTILLLFKKMIQLKK